MHTVFVASEAANMVHVIDVARQEVIEDILVATRPRRFALTPGGKELWVSAELAGEVDIIDVASLKVIGSVPFRPKGFRREEVTPVLDRVRTGGTSGLRDVQLYVAALAMRDRLAWPDDLAERVAAG